MLKTLYARYGNVKVSKFVASQEEMQSSDYNPDEFEGINDLEIVLNSLGIKLRESATEWKNFDQVIQDIAEHWDSWDLTTKNAISTAFAGTRQRENFLTLMDSWEDVEKYADIASNSYGTATEKMEAYTDSVEAAQQRIKVATEKWSLSLNSGEALKKFYDAIAFATENIHWLIATIGGLMVLSNLTSVIGFVSNGFSKFGAKMTDIGTIFDKVKISMTSFKESLDASRTDSDIFRNEDWAHNKKDLFKNRTKRLNMSESQSIAFGEAQSFAFSLQAQQQRDMARLLRGDFHFEQEQELNGDIRNIAGTLGRFLDTDTRRNVDILNLLQRISDGDIVSSLDQEQQQLLNNTLDELRENDSNFAEFLNQLDESSDMGDANEATSRGIFMAVGGGIGAYGMQSVGASLFGEGFGQVAGGTLGALIGTTGGRALADGALKTFARGLPVVFSGSATDGIIAALGGASVIGGVISLVITALSAGFAYWKKRQQELLKEAQEDFKVAEENYSKARGTNATAKSYDKLSAGVDSFGNNVSLTDEEYSEFLRISNELAEIFPSLTVKIDENGNKLIGYGSVVGTVADEVERLNTELQKEADSKLLNPTLFENSFGEVYKEVQELENKRNRLQKETMNPNEKEEFYDKYGLSTNSSVQEKQKAKVLELREYEKQIKNARAQMNDYIMAESRKLQNSAKGQNYSDLINKMSEEEKQVYDNIVSSLDISQKDENGLHKNNWWNGEYELKSEDEIQADLEAVAKKLKSLDDGIMETIFNPDIKYKTIGDMNTNREKIIDELIKQFFNDDGKFDEKEKQIIIGLGFEIVDNEIKDPQNILEKFKNEFNIKNQNGDNGISLENLSVLSVEDAEKAFEYFNQGVLNTTDSMETLVNLLYADREMPSFIEGAEVYVKEMGDNYTQLYDKTKKFFSGEEWRNKNVNEVFSEYPLMVRQAIEEAQKEWDKGTVDIEEFFDSIQSMASSKMIDIMGQFAELKLMDAFGSNFTQEVDGYVDSMDELLKSLKELAGTYDLLSKAQKENSLYGELSIQTVAELLATNVKYAEVIQFETDAENNNVISAHLATDAKKTMLGIQVEALKTTYQAAMAKEAETIAYNNHRLALLGNTKDQIHLAEQTGSTIDVNNSMQTSLNQLVATFGALGAMLNAIINLDFSQGLDAVYNNAYNSLLAKAGEVKSVDWKSVYSGMSEEDLAKETERLKESNKNSKANYDAYQLAIKQLDTAQKTGNYGKLGEDFRSGSSKSSGNEDGFKIFEPNKEWEAMQAKDYKRYTEYFVKKEKSLQTEEAYLKAQYKNAKTEKERVEILEKLQENHVKLKNLNDEEVQDQINILESRKASIEAIIIQYEALLKTADTEEELIQYQEKLNDKLREEYEIRKKINDYQNELIDVQLKYSSGTAYSDSGTYDSMVQQQIENYKKNAEIAMDQINFETKKAYESYLKDVDNMGNKLYTAQEAWIKAQNSEKVQEATKQYIQAVEAQAELAIKSVTDKINEISREIDKIEKQKPQEWSSFSQIKEYGENTIEYLNQKLSVIQEALKDTSNLTDEQIISLVDQLNEATVAIHEAQIAMHEGIKERQESIYSALVNQVQRYIDELERAKDAVEDAYKDPIKDIEDYNKALDRTNKLLELQNKLKTAQREKKRVYREGIGWVFESDREKVKEAQNNLDDFYRDDKLNDLEEAKNNELALLDERIEGWNRYLQALQERYEQWQVQEEQKLLMELINVETEEQLHQRILEDMLNYNENAQGMYNDYIGIFENFLEEYRLNLEKLQTLKEQELKLMSPDSYLDNNGLNGNKNNGGFGFDKDGGSGGWTQAEMDEGFNGVSKPANKYTDNKGNNIYQSAYDKYVSNGQMDKAHEVEQEAASRGQSIVKKYSTGIEQGPVTYTGLAMLHGSMSEPEYILNNDQAYNLLYNMSTRKIADFESTKQQENGTQYIVQGDIILEGVNDPEKFWQEVTTAMGNRWNVTKNR